MTVKTADRVPLEDMREIIAAALVPGDYEHDSAWTRSGSCPCHELPGRSCLRPPEEGGCQGHAAEVDTPAEHVVSLDILTAALPEPDNDGTVGAQEAALSVLRVIETRLGGTYVLRAHHLRKRLTEEAGLYEQAHGAPDSVIPVTAVSVLTCQWCSQPIPLARGPKARYCRNSHRVSAHRAKKREQERQANAGASPGR